MVNSLGVSKLGMSGGPGGRISDRHEGQPSGPPTASRGAGASVPERPDRFAAWLGFVVWRRLCPEPCYADSGRHVLGQMAAELRELVSSR
jgi:hypothetical protein